MKCPKCQYISFDSGGRCRNCGYDFSLADDVASLDLPMADASAVDGPLQDFSLQDLDKVLAPPAPDSAPLVIPSPPPPSPSPTGELPLFKDRALPDDAPLVSPGAAPRPPLAVRRTTQPLGKPRGRKQDPAPPEPRLALETAEIPIVPERARGAAAPAAASDPNDDRTHAVSAGPGARLVAAAIDLLILGGIDLIVVYFTLKICDLPMAAAGTLPIAPLAAFFGLTNGGYFAAFVAAGGQTIGKMAAGIRVIPGDPVATATERVTAGHAIARAAAYLVSAVPIGLGFVPGFVGQDRRALHDRLADTRVVKA